MSWLPKKPIVVPTDFSPYSIAAAATAREMVTEGSDLHLVHVLHPPLIGIVRQNVDEEERRQHVMQLFGEHFASPQFARAHHVALVGDPGSEVANYALRMGAELIVLPSHGYTGLKHLLIGSVAERVVRLSHCPVLVLRK